MFHRPHERSTIAFREQGRTQQAFKDQCDVNQIMARYARHGVLDHANTYRGVYGDFTEVGDYHTLCNQVVRAQEMFMGLPAEVRKMFNNDPGAFLEFAENPENADQMVEMGLMRREDAPVDALKYGEPSEEAPESTAPVEPNSEPGDGPQAA